MQLAGIEVLFNGTPAPMFAVSNINGDESIVVQVPFEINPGPASVTIRTPGGISSTVENVPIEALKPGVFTVRDASGAIYASATRPDGSYVTSSNPARRGESISIYATGLGQTMPATGTNRLGQAGQAVAASVVVGVNHQGNPLVSAELLPGTVGVYVVTFEIPADTTSGMNQPLGLGVTDGNGQTVYANSTTIPIQ
jgi:uncharacterized protein (TIGR03437 family)